MRLSNFAIKNYQFTIVIFLLLTAIGFSAFKSIPRTEDPYFPISAFNVVSIYPGADPGEIERQVAEPIEDAINELDDVKEIISTSRDSVGVVNVEFYAHVDVDKKYDELTRSIAALRSSLPPGVKSVEIRKINPGLVNIVQLALVSETASYAAMADAAEDLQDRLERVAGVRKSETWAYPQKELRVSLNLKKLAELKIRPGDVLNVIQAENTNIPGGSVEEGDRRFNVKTTGSYTSVEQVRNTVVRGAGLTNGSVVRVSDIADVGWDNQAKDYTGRFNGKRAVFVTANQKDGQNIFVTKDGIDAALEEFEKTLPANIKLERGFDQSRNVDQRLTRLGKDFGIALVLVLFTLIPLGLRAAGIVMVSIPLSLATGLAALYFAGFSLNQLSIAGFVVALGLLVDDSIVVIENIARYMRMGYSRVEAAKEATSQITLAVLGCTATLLFAFLPLLMLPGNAGKFIRSLPLSVVFTVLASLFVALTIIPFLASRVMPQHESEHGNVYLQKLMTVIDRVYAPFLRVSLSRPKTTLIASMLLFVASLGLVPSIGFSLFPKADTPQFLIQINLPNGSSLQATEKALNDVEAILKKTPEVARWMSNLGHGNPKIYYNIFTRELSSNYAEAFVQLKEYNPKTTPHMFDRLRQQFAGIAGADVLVKEFENGPPIDAPIAVRVVGPDLDQLKNLSTEVERIVKANPGTQNVVNPQRTNRVDLKFKLDEDKAGLLGVQSLDLDQSVRAGLAGISAGNFKEPDGDSYPIVLRGPMKDRPELAALDGFHIATAAGGFVPMDQIVTKELTSSPDSIYRHQRERAILITAYTKSGYNTEAVTRELQKAVESVKLPQGYRINFAGEIASRKDSFAGFGTAILVTVFGILAILVLEFGSFKSTLIVLTVIPLGVMGGLVLLFLSGYSLSFTAMVGFIALIGIEIKNSILLVDFTNQLRREGKSIDEAVQEAGQIRFLPILLTSATAIGGLMPLATQGSGLYSPMAWVIIGGLISSTLIGRFVTPVLYKLLPPVIEGEQG